MRAVVLPFEHPQKSTRSIPPPLIIAHRSAVFVKFIGTRKQLRSWGIEPPEEAFPIPPKRVVYTDGCVVRALRRGLFQVDYYCLHMDKYKHRAERLKLIVTKAQSAHALISAASRMLVAVNGWNIDPNPYVPSTKPYDRAKEAFQRAVIDAVFRKLDEDGVRYY